MKNTIATILLALLCGCATRATQPTTPAASTFPAAPVPPPPAPSVKAAVVRRIQSTSSAGTNGVTAMVSRSVTPPPAVTLAWDSEIPTPAGYRLYFGNASRAYTNVIDAGTGTFLTVSNLAFGSTYFFAATAYAAAGMESDYSIEATYTTPAAILPPGNFRITASFAGALPGPWQQDTNWPPIVVFNPLGNVLWRLDAERIQP